MKKVFPKVLKAIKDAQGENCIEEEGTNRNKRYRYVGASEEPLSDLLHAKVIDDITQYWQFCQNSAGFFPESWLDYFFKDSRDLLDIKTKKKRGEQIIGTGIDRQLKNIELLPFLYEAISRKQVIAVKYKPYIEDEQSLVLHPHYLREYNGRWFLFGYADGEQYDDYPRNLALDRIVDKPREVYKVNYRPAPKGFYNEFFKNIIGVSHINGNCQESEDATKIHRITIRTYSRYMFGLIQTKKFHSSQITTKGYENHADGEYGEFEINVEVNNELIGSILHYGSDIEVISPAEVRDILKTRIEDLSVRYSNPHSVDGQNGTSE